MISSPSIQISEEPGIFVPEWRGRKCEAFSLADNSTAGTTTRVSLWGATNEIYSNANLSVYSAQSCNARCMFCVEELRPASRGMELGKQKSIERVDAIYFSALESTLNELSGLNPSVSVTGGEPSKDSRLARILQLLQRKNMRKRTMTTNGSGLFDEIDGCRVIDWVIETGIQHLNISRAHPDCNTNARIMRLPDGLRLDQLSEVARIGSTAGTRLRLSCVLLHEAVCSLDGVVAYLEFAESLGIDNVIFRQLMKTDDSTHQLNHVVKYSNQQRVALEPLLEEISRDPVFTFQRQIVGYYYYVEVWRYKHIDVVFEEADLARLEAVKRTFPGVIHELVFHPDGKLASTWQPRDGMLGPPDV